MTKVTITIDESPEKIKEIVEAVEQAIKPKPDKNGRCQCKEPDFVHMEYDCSYCRKCGGGYH